MGTIGSMLEAGGRRPVESQQPQPRDLLEALRDLATGRVHRSRHELTVDGMDLSETFRAVLAQEGYRPARIKELAIERGVRHPAFLIRGSTAHFGHVFVEKFHENETRTLFGSVVRDWRGDWDIMLTRRSAEVVWVSLDQASPFDEDRPSSGL
jgi:hypothetical protein